MVCGFLLLSDNVAYSINKSYKSYEREHIMSQFKRKLSAFTAMLAFVSMSSMNAFAALPTDVIGNTSNMGINGDDTKLNVNIQSGIKGDVGQVDWNQFSVPGGQTVNFGFTGLNQTIINRVLGGQSSEILGKLTSSCGNGNCSSFEQTSKVILINPAGVMFGAGSAVDLNSFTVSTFDFTGARNLRNMSEADLKAYQSGVLNKFSPEKNLNGTGQNFGHIHFDSNYTQAFDEAGIDRSSYFGKTQIGLNGTTFDVDKSIALISDNIDYRDSLLKTGDNYNYITSSGGNSYSNVKLITADGVTFKYLKNGYADNDYVIDEDTKSDVVRNINIDNSGLAADDVAIKSGNISISNKSNADGSNIRIANSVIKGTKLVNTERGDIVIAGNKDVTIDNSRLETINTSVTYKGVTTDTTNNAGGEIAITGNSVTVGDSLLMTAGSNEGTYKLNTSGRVRLYGQQGNVNVENTKIISAGDVTLDTAGKVDVDGSLIYATNEFTDPTVKRDINIYGMQGIDINNSVIDATKNVNIAAESGRGTLTGDVNITSDLKNGKNQTFINAGDKLSIKGQNTTLDNASTFYKNIVFYGDGSTGTNNVTAKNNTTFTQKNESGTGNGQTVLETNGDFIMDGASMAASSYSLRFDRNSDGSLIDNGTVDGINYLIASATDTPVNLTVTSTEGNVTVRNNSNIVADQNITFTSQAGNVNIFDSELTATRGDITANAQNNLQSTNSTLNAGENITLTAQTGNATVNAAGVGLAHSKSKINAGKKLTIAANNGDVNVSLTNIHAGDKLTADMTKTDELLDQHSANFTGRNVNILDSGVDAKGDVNVTATEGDANIGTANEGVMTFLAGGDINVNAKTNAKFDVQGGSYPMGVVRATGDFNMTAQDGSAKILGGTRVTADNINVTAHDTIKFGMNNAADTNIGNTASLNAAKNINITTTGAEGDIIAEKNEMGTVQYGGRLKFDAKRDNIISSTDSFKGVKVDFVAGRSNNISAANDLQLVDSTLTSANNNISTTVDGDVILNRVTLNKATDNAKDTVTRINAKGNVTTADVTNSVAADVSKDKNTAFYSVDWTGDATKPTASQKTILDVNQTKLVVNTNVDALTPDNNTNGSVYLDVRNANNAQAGIEITAENTAWDAQIGAGQGPEVRVDAADNELAISKIVTDKLTLSIGDKMIAADVELTPEQLAGLPDGTPSKGYIEVRDKGGFNMDESETYDNTNIGFNYNTGEHYDSIVDVKEDKEVITGDRYQVGDPVVSTDENGNTITTTTFETPTTTNTTTTTTTTDRKHTIDFEKQNEGDKFILVYEKSDTTVEHSSVTENVRDQEVSVETCPPDLDDIEDTDRSDVDADSMIDQIRLPREQVEVSKTSKVSDNTVDQTANVMSAAAKIDLGQSANNNDEDEDSEEE